MKCFWFLYFAFVLATCVCAEDVPGFGKNCDNEDCGCCVVGYDEKGCQICECKLDNPLNNDVRQPEYEGLEQNIARAANKNAKRWGKAADNETVVIPYLLDALTRESPKRIKIILRSMRLFSSATCIQFRPATKADVDKIEFRVLDGACYTFLGKIGGTQPIYLANSCVVISTVTHEIMHVLGFDHEFKRPDRDDYIKVHKDNIIPGIFAQFTKVRAKDINSYGSPYDFNSVLNYDGYASSINAKPTITVKKTGKVYRETALSPSIEDLNQIRAMYGCTKRGLNETTTCYHTSDHGYSYRGRVNTTIGNLTCQRWNSTFPNNHYFKSDTYTAAGLDENYCRNPTMLDMPWCYVASGGKMWEYCDVPVCQNSVTLVPDITPVKRYPGFWDPWTTWSICSKTCDRGLRYRTRKCVGNDIGSPNCQGSYWHSERCSIKSCYDRDGTIWSNWNPWSDCSVACGNGTETRIRTCRSDGHERTFTCPSDSVEKRPCIQKDCSKYYTQSCYDPVKPSIYRGNASTTTNGSSCEMWNKTILNITKYGSFDMRENYCRNPLQDNRPPWCYIKGTNTTMNCSITICNKGAYWSDFSVWSPCTATCKNGTQYRTRSCIGGSIGNGKCRGAATEQKSCNTFICDYAGGAPPLPISSPKQVISKGSECFNASDRSSYRGSAHLTVDGFTCLPWMSPFTNPYYLTNQDKFGLRENHCRPLIYNWPICYAYRTGSSTPVLKYCTVSLCPTKEVAAYEPNGCYDPHDRQSYRGNITVTQKGVTCQRWDVMTPHPSSWIIHTKWNGIGQHNYCRNPDFSFRGPWCYTTDPHLRVDYCNVPICKTKYYSVLSGKPNA
uniref:apolipoprotein(a)-like isoform X1 n=1 Tax=Ciona intestinalis TaxID=7719 RepID=UPI000EF47122|nr:apolipoprotein(a)-like isoform X1 [Ciona intestinalis]|eukprot:XP_026691060.1 apolipoprotein(a)-like isoform X1 [Ciona intestinalis]